MREPGPGRPLLLGGRRRALGRRAVAALARLPGPPASTSCRSCSCAPRARPSPRRRPRSSPSCARPGRRAAAPRAADRDGVTELVRAGLEGEPEEPLRRRLRRGHGWHPVPRAGAAGRAAGRRDEAERRPTPAASASSGPAPSRARCCCASGRLEPGLRLAGPRAGRARRRRRAAPRRGPGRARAGARRAARPTCSPPRASWSAAASCSSSIRSCARPSTPTCRASERETRHARAARIFAAEGATPDRVAAHLLAAAPAGDPWAVERLREAAAAAAGARARPSPPCHYLRAPWRSRRRPSDRPAAAARPRRRRGARGLVERRGHAPAGGAGRRSSATRTSATPGCCHGRALALQERPRAAIEAFDSAAVAPRPAGARASG